MRLAFYSGLPNAMTTVTLQSSLVLCPSHIHCWQTRDEFVEPVQRVGKLLAHGCEAKAKVRRHVKIDPLP